MQRIVIEGTPKTPTVEFDPEQGMLLIKGRSIPENAIEFYNPLIDWIDGYAMRPSEHTTVNVQLEYFNTSSSKCILDLFKKLELIKRAGKQITVRWHYEQDDEDMQEAGEDYQTIIDLKFEMIEMEE